MLDSFSSCKLHASFCMSLCGSELWNYNSRSSSPSSLSDIESSNIDTVRDLLSIRDEVLICPILHLAAGTLINNICIS